MSSSSSLTSVTSRLALPLYGSIKCMATYESGKACKHNAYYVHRTNVYHCGQHTQSRTKLPQLSAKEKESKAEEEYKLHMDTVEAGKQENARKVQPGKVKLFKMRMMKSVIQTPGYLSIFPNNKHANRKDGLGLATLSPMRLGPVKHGQPGLPDALNIENFHQGGKQFPGENDEAFKKTQIQMYQDAVPHRHKIKHEKPLHSVWIDKDGTRKTVTYVQSRQFYCTFYERLVLPTDEFKRLKKIVESGVNVQLCGYDAYPLGSQTPEEAYLDPLKPFGHERVLYCLLTKSQPEEWPWRKHALFEF